MHYSEDLDFVITNALDELIRLYNKKSVMFNAEKNHRYYEKYNKLKKK